MPSLQQTCQKAQKAKRIKYLNIFFLKYTHCYLSNSLILLFNHLQFLLFNEYYKDFNEYYRDFNEYYKDFNVILFPWQPETVPQARIDMTRVLEVAAAEDVTGHPNSLAITSPEGVTFVKGTCREETRWWGDVLQVYARNKVSYSLYFVLFISMLIITTISAGPYYLLVSDIYFK